MPSYAIHLAVAEEYLRNNKNVTEQHNEFIQGVIYPDTVQDKAITHYNKNSSESNLQFFLKEKSMDNSFNRGHFLHLVTDYIFYNQYIETWSKDIYHDYDILHEKLVKKYKLCIPEEVKFEMAPSEKKGLTILSEPLINQFIQDVSNRDINQIAKEVENNPTKWTRIRPLKFV